MNLLRMIVRNPLSIGAVLLVYPLLISFCVSLLYLGIRYWYITLGSYLLLCMIGGTGADTTLNNNQRQSQEIDAHCDYLRQQRISLLWTIGRPEDNGDLSERQEGIWAQVKELERQEQEFLQGTEVVNLDPLGHDIGRVYKNRKR